MQFLARMGKNKKIAVFGLFQDRGQLNLAISEMTTDSSKQKRQARHIEERARKKGRSSKTAARIAWATVSKQDGGGEKSGSGRKRSSEK